MADTNAYEGPAPDQGFEAGFGDYVALLKPRVMSLVVFTAFSAAVVEGLWRQLPASALLGLVVVALLLAAAPWIIRVRRSLATIREEKMLADARAEAADFAAQGFDDGEQVVLVFHDRLLTAATARASCAAAARAWCADIPAPERRGGASARAR